MLVLLLTIAEATILNLRLVIYTVCRSMHALLHQVCKCSVLYSFASSKTASLWQWDKTGTILKIQTFKTDEKHCCGGKKKGKKDKRKVLLMLRCH